MVTYTRDSYSIRNPMVREQCISPMVMNMKVCDIKASVMARGSNLGLLVTTTMTTLLANGRMMRWFQAF